MKGPKVERRPRTRVKQNEPIRANQIDTTTTSLATEQEYKLFAFRIIELVDELLSLRDGHGAVQAEEAVSMQVSIPFSSAPNTKSSLLLPAYPLKEIERLRVIADQHDLVIRRRPESMQEATRLGKSVPIQKQATLERPTVQARGTSLPNHTVHSGYAHFWKLWVRRNLPVSDYQSHEGPRGGQEAQDGCKASSKC